MRYLLVVLLAVVSLSSCVTIQQRRDEFLKNAKYPKKEDISMALESGELDNNLVYDYIDDSYYKCIAKIARRTRSRRSILSEDAQTELERATVNCFFVIFNRETDIPGFANYSKIDEAVVTQKALTLSYEKIDKIYKEFWQRFPDETVQQDMKVDLAELKMKIAKLSANISKYYYYGEFYEPRIYYK